MSADKVIDLKREPKRRIDHFRKRCVENAKSRKQFYRSFLIDQDHIIARGADQNSSLRAAIQPMHIAAIILSGRVDYAASRSDPPVEIAIDGTFRNFKYVEFMTTKGIAEIEIPRLQVRVVLRDGRIKIAVVTVYPLKVKEDLGIPEIDYEIW